MEYAIYQMLIFDVVIPMQIFMLLLQCTSVTKPVCTIR